MASYKINYHLTNCNTTAISSVNYDTEGNIIYFAAKAVDGCYFLPSDGDYNYISRLSNGTIKITNFNLSRVPSSDNSKVINGSVDGITSDGKYLAKRLTFGTANTGEMECYLNARGGKPTVKTLNVINNVSGTVATYVQNGENYDITLTGDTDGSYSVVPVVSYRNESGTETTGEMNVNGKIATFSVPVATNDVVTITGTFTPGTPQKDVPITYTLTNCTVSPQPQTVKTGSTLNMTVQPLANYNLDLCNLIWNDGTKDVTISVTGGVISFPVPDSCVSINVKAVASIITPVGRNYGAINVYCVTLDNLDAFSKKRFFEIKDDTQGIYEEVNLGIFVNRIKRIFTNVPVSGTDSLKCGNYNTGITVQTPEKDVILLDFGNVTLTGLNGDSEDYNAHISVFIPCRGFVAVDSKYIGKTVNLSFKVNVITGDAVAFLSCDGVIFQLESFSLARDVIYKTGTTELNIVGGTQWDEQIMYGLEPYVIITQNNTINKPVNNTQESVTIGDVTGYAQFENVDLNTVNMSVDEYNTIISYLENGVYL